MTRACDPILEAVESGAYLPRFAGHFQSANAWDWQPPRRWQYVYALWDCVPKDYLPEFIRRLVILGSYGSLSRNEPPLRFGGVSRRSRVPGRRCGLGRNSAGCALRMVCSGA
jgi:hypothetical protein